MLKGRKAKIASRASVISLYQSRIETSADLNSDVLARKDVSVTHENSGKTGIITLKNKSNMNFSEKKIQGYLFRFKSVRMHGCLSLITDLGFV